MDGFNNLIQLPLVDVLGETLLHFLWQGALVAGLLAVALHVLRGASPNLRYALCAGAMGLLLLLPVATGVQVYLQRSMGSGQWAMDTGQWSMDSGQVSAVSGQVSANNNRQPATPNPEPQTRNPEKTASGSFPGVMNWCWRGLGVWCFSRSDS